MSNKFLIIGPSFFGYRNLISEQTVKLKKFNSVYQCSDIYPFYSYLGLLCKKSKILDFIFLWLYNFYIKFVCFCFKPEHVLVILGRGISERTLIYLKNKNIKVTLYMWDSFINYPRVKGLIPYYHDVFTFDKHDSLELSVKYEPLFYVKELVKIKKPIYDFIFIGSVHGDRLDKLNELNKLFLKSGVTYKFSLYMPSLIHYIKAFYFDYKSKFDFKFSDFTFKSMTIEQSYDAYASARFVIDIPNANQNGYTMRTFETLGSDRFLLTTNKTLLNDNCFNKNNIIDLDSLSDMSILNILNQDFKSDSAIERQELSIWLNRVVL